MTYEVSGGSASKSPLFYCPNFLQRGLSKSFSWTTAPPPNEYSCFELAGSATSLLALTGRHRVEIIPYLNGEGDVCFIWARGRAMGIFFIFLWHLWSHYWWFLTSGPLVIEPMLEYLFPRYEAWVNQFISRRKRRQIAYGLSIFGFVAASFFAFSDIYLKLEAKEKELAQAYRMLNIRGREQPSRVIEKLETANTQLEAELRSTRDQLSTLQEAVTPRRLAPEARDKLTAVLASYDGRQFGVIDVRAFPSCNECMLYMNDIVSAINSLPEWTAKGGPNSLLRPDFVGLGIGIKDPQSLAPAVHILGEALRAAELQFSIETLDFVSPDSFMLIIGNKP
jgi:hypothetical protein